MIYRIYANDKRFKSVNFHKGLNVILADRKKESNDKDSRNGIGKTTLINVLHFCLGSNLNNKILPVSDINEWKFYLDLELCGRKITACRSVDRPGIIEVSGDIDALPVKPETDYESNVQFYKLQGWRELLGVCLFNIGSSVREKYTPSFRTLISYYIRVGIDAYNSPFSYTKNQSSWQVQIANAFFLGLNWDHASEVQELKDKNKAATALDKAIKTSIIPTKGELEAERVRLQNEIESEENELASFRVHPQYYDLQNKANELTEEIHVITNKNMMLRRKFSRYEQSSLVEKEPDFDNVSDLYEEAGFHFGDAVRKTLEETKRFHTEVVENRKSFLQTELLEVKNEISSNNQMIERKTSQRAEVMNLLQTHGALDEFSKLQKMLIEKQTKLTSLETTIADMKSMTTKKKELKSDRLELDSKIQRDFEESRPLWELAIEDFNQNSLALYNNPGNLILNVSERGVVTDNAYSFDVEIPRSSSEGVSKMKIFCYDLMLVALSTQRGGIDFLIHDSTMFDGVDSRQVAHALEHANKKGSDIGFQYICTFNSDSIPFDDFSEDFEIEKYVCLRLSDQSPEESLFGFQF